MNFSSKRLNCIKIEWEQPSEEVFPKPPTNQPTDRPTKPIQTHLISSPAKHRHRAIYSPQPNHLCPEAEGRTHVCMWETKATLKTIYALFSTFHSSESPIYVTHLTPARQDTTPVAPGCDLFSEISDLGVLQGCFSDKVLSYDKKIN